MSNSTEFTDETALDDATCTKPYLISLTEQQSAVPYVLDSMTWEDEVEKIVVLCNN